MKRNAKPRFRNALSRVGLAALLVAVIPGCGGTTGATADSTVGSDTSTVQTGRQLGEDAPFLYTERSDGTWEVRATVVESPGEQPAICTGSGSDSLPPICGNVPIENWNWGDVEGEFRDGGSTWGTFHFVGTLDEDTFTVDAFVE
jgi:hypothetical protein